MKSFVIAATVTLLGVGATPVTAADALKLKDEKDKISYSIGLDMGNNLKRQEVDVNVDALAAGIRDSMTGTKPKMTEEEIKQTVDAYQQKFMARQAEKAGKLKKDGDTFLEANKKKEGVKTTASGLQYKVMKEGKGKSPAATDMVTTHYRGTLVDGTEFDSSYKRGEPVEFPVNGVIRGWTEALQLMKEGSKWQLFIPSELGYGERGAGNSIPPHSTLIFEVELIKVGGK